MKEKFRISIISLFSFAIRLSNIINNELFLPINRSKYAALVYSQLGRINVFHLELL